MSEEKLKRAIELMIKTDHMHKHLIDACVKDIGVQHTRHRILMHLARRKTLPSQKELAEHLNITPAAVTLSLKKLEAEGYIEKSLGQDNRFNELTITEKGKELVTKTKDSFFKTDRAVFEGFSAEELDCYIECLLKMQENIEKQIHLKGRDESR